MKKNYTHPFISVIYFENETMLVAPSKQNMQSLVGNTDDILGADEYIGGDGGSVDSNGFVNSKNSWGTWDDEEG